MCVSGDKKCSFFRKFDVLCFLEKPILRFALLPYYRQNVMVIEKSVDLANMYLFKFNNRNTMLKVNIKDTRTTPLALSLTLNIFHTLL